MKILANDGIDKEGKSLLEKAGFTVITEKVPQDQLEQAINTGDIKGIIVRSATTVRKNIIDNCPGLKLIARAGVGMDNIDVDYAKSKGLHVVNTPAASSMSVAELVFAHLFTTVRFLHDSNRKMPSEGNTNFDGLKKSYSKGKELRGKTLGIIGFGRIGQAVAKIAFGLGMDVKAYDPYVKEATIKIDIAGTNGVAVHVTTVPLEDIFKSSDMITLHVPGGAMITSRELQMMKNGVIIVNASRGGVIVEEDLLAALDSGKVSHAALDVFVGEPKPSDKLLKHPSVSLTPHIGASTEEAQERIGVELANQIIDLLK